MTVSQLIEWLKTQDQEATVKVVQKDKCFGYYNEPVFRHVPFNETLSQYTDLRGNPFITPDEPYYNERILLLGDI